MHFGLILDLEEVVVALNYGLYGLCMEYYKNDQEVWKGTESKGGWLCREREDTGKNTNF